MENYQVLRKIGSGNFAKVYLAVHTPTGRRVGATRRAAPACERARGWLQPHIAALFRRSVDAVSFFPYHRSLSR